MSVNYKQHDDNIKTLKENADIRMYTNNHLNESVTVNEKLVENKTRFEMENVHRIQQVILLPISFNKHTDKFNRWTARRQRL